METKISLQNDALWNRLQKFSPDAPNVDFPFSKKLAKEENWTLEFTKKAIEEYKKFVYLCCILPNGASPSETVDKVWHMHLIYTENYWEEFFPRILQRKLHHHPSKGGFVEKDKHRKWFSDTLKSYQEIFQQEAPRDIWYGKEKAGSRTIWLKRLRIIPLLITLFMLSSCLGEVLGSLTLAALPIIGFFIFFHIVGAFQGNSENIVGKKKDDRSIEGGGDGGSASSCGGDGGGGGCSGGCGGGCGGCGGGCGG